MTWLHVKGHFWYQVMKKHTIYFSIKCSIPASIMQELVLSFRNVPFGSRGRRRPLDQYRWDRFTQGNAYHFLSLVPIDHEGLFGYHFYHNSKGNHFAMKRIWRTFMARNNRSFTNTKYVPCQNKSKFMFFKFFLQQVNYKASSCLVKALFSFLLAHRDEGCSCAREVPPRPV